MCNKYLIIIITWNSVFLFVSNVVYSRKLLLPSYDPVNVKWTLVVQSCNEAFAFEKRYASFFIRTSAHDSLAFNNESGGADGSVLLTKDELSRPENTYDKFTHKLAPVAKKIAFRTGASVADVIAVCGAVAVEYLGGPNIFEINTTTPFYVGRSDTNIANPHKQLAKGSFNTTEFANFAQTKGLSLQEMIALMGSHVLIDDQNCKNNDGTECDPTIEKCDKIKMFTWSNLYYKDVCTMPTTIYMPAIEVVENITRADRKKHAMCRYTSQKFKNEQAIDALAETEAILGQDGEVDPITGKLPHGFQNVIVNLSDRPLWSYTINDAHLGKACQNKKVQPRDTDGMISSYMKEFAINPVIWNNVYAEAYKKMISLRAMWSNKIEIPL